MATRPPIRVLDLAGSPTQIGAAHGTAYAEEIRRYTNDRVELVASGLWSGGPMSRDEVVAIAESMLPAQEAFDVDLHTEMVDMADAACQIAVEPYHIESSGAAVMRPATGDFWACWGRPAENEYEHVSFESEITND